ncbi:hypothetical protein [Azospirillum largimobile]
MPAAAPGPAQWNSFENPFHSPVALRRRPLVTHLNSGGD